MSGLRNPNIHSNLLAVSNLFKNQFLVKDYDIGLRLV